MGLVTCGISGRLFGGAVRPPGRRKAISFHLFICVSDCVCALWLSLSGLELAVIEGGIERSFSEQFAVGALFDYISVIHDEDDIGISDR